MGNRHQRRSREQWTVIIESHAASGLTIADYCQANEIGLASFNKWKRRLRDDAPRPSRSQPIPSDFSPVQLIEPHDSSTTVTLSLGVNITLTINTTDAAG